MAGNSCTSWKYVSWSWSWWRRCHILVWWLHLRRFHSGTRLFLWTKEFETLSRDWHWRKRPCKWREEVHTLWFKTSWIVCDCTKFYYCCAVQDAAFLTMLWILGAAKNCPTPAIERLGIAAHVWGTECASGLGSDDASIAGTTFPQVRERYRPFVCLVLANMQDTKNYFEWLNLRYSNEGHSTYENLICMRTRTRWQREGLWYPTYHDSRDGYIASTNAISHRDLGWQPRLMKCWLRRLVWRCIQNCEHNTMKMQKTASSHITMASTAGSGVCGARVANTLVHSGFLLRVHERTCTYLCGTLDVRVISSLLFFRSASAARVYLCRIAKQN